MKTSSRSRYAAALASVPLLAAMLLVAPAPAIAKDYPTWDDVTQARGDEAATQNAIASIESLLGELTATAERTAAESEIASALWEEADEKFQIAANRALKLREQADAAATAAESSRVQAGQMAAQLIRGQGQDLTARLLTSSSNPDQLIYGLAMSAKVAEQANAVYERALRDQNTAQALTDQANVAQEALGELRAVAEERFAAAQTAAAAASAALAEQEANRARLQQQLVVLTERRAATEADYLAGVKERFGSNGGLDAGEISPSGWAKPVAGRITDSYGYRIPPTSGASSFHRGTDIGAGCGQPIYAASSGNVVYAGWNGSYGNFVQIDHGGGVSTAYAHIIEGGILVSNGQSVGVGTNIARVGTTGVSTGCHSHFEVRINGVATDAEVFMRNQGISLG
jgi:murein DD-endopeptidase MepM/ murein hydrolase activator NlpD